MLDDDEGVLKSYENIELGISNNIETIDEFYLTNKGISYKYEKGIGLFKPSEEIIEKHLYSDIKVIDNNINVFKINDDDNYGDGIRIFYNGGIEEFYIFYDKKDLEECYNTIIEKVNNKNNIVEIKETQNNQLKNNDLFSNEIQKANVSNDESTKEEVKEIEESPKLINNSTEVTKTKICSKCGEKIDINSKFCMFCGNSLDEKIKEEIKLQDDIVKTERRTVYQGEIHKCSNCGEILKSFVEKCPSCGFELRNTNLTSSIKNFQEKYEEIELSLRNEKKGFFSRLTGPSKELRLANFIQEYPIPTNKEDLYEFMILSSSNIGGYSFWNSKDYEAKKTISNAWMSKLEQVYKKAQIVFKDSDDLERIKRIYDDSLKKLKKQQFKDFSLILSPFIIIIIMMVFIFLIEIIFPDNRTDAEKRDADLKYTVNKIEDDIANGKCKDAKNKAYTLTFDEELDLEKHQYWEKKQQDIFKMIDNACKE